MHWTLVRGHIPKLTFCPLLCCTICRSLQASLYCCRQLLLILYSHLGWHHQLLWLLFCHQHSWYSYLRNVIITFWSLFVQQLRCLSWVVIHKSYLNIQSSFSILALFFHTFTMLRNHAAFTFSRFSIKVGANTQADLELFLEDELEGHVQPISPRDVKGSRHLGSEGLTIPCVSVIWRSVSACCCTALVTWNPFICICVIRGWHRLGWGGHRRSRHHSNPLGILGRKVMPCKSELMHHPMIHDPLDP